MGYYDLASAVYPENGASHHQLAVVAQSSGSQFRAVYHLYRSLAVTKPHPMARANLEKELRKIAVSLPEYEPDGSDRGVERLAVANLLQLHAQTYKVEDLTHHINSKQKTLVDLTDLLLGRATESVLNKVMLINIAGQYFAGLRLQGQSNNHSMRYDS